MSFLKKCLLIVSALLAVILTSCGTKAKSYVILEVAGYDHVLEADHANEFDWKPKEYTNVDAPPAKIIEINGEIIEGSYDCSRNSYRYDMEADYYEGTNGSKTVTFGISQATGRIIRYSWCDTEYVENHQAEPKKNRDECYQSALKYLQQYVSDADAYSLEKEQYWNIPEYNGAYEFNFVRKIGDKSTTDYAIIDVTIYGHVYGHLFGQLGEMKNVDVLTQDKQTEIQTQVFSKLDQIYTNLKNEYQTKYEVSDLVITKLSDGKLALEYHVDVSLQSYSDATSKLNETTHFIVYLD